VALAQSSLRVCALRSVCCAATCAAVGVGKRPPQACVKLTRRGGGGIAASIGSCALA
jgi:hypothetical protein